MTLCKDCLDREFDKKQITLTHPAGLEISVWPYCNSSSGYPITINCNGTKIREESLKFPPWHSKIYSERVISDLVPTLSNADCTETTPCPGRMFVSEFVRVAFNAIDAMLLNEDYPWIYYSEGYYEGYSKVRLRSGVTEILKGTQSVDIFPGARTRWEIDFEGEVVTLHASDLSSFRPTKTLLTAWMGTFFRPFKCFGPAWIQTRNYWCDPKIVTIHKEEE